MNQDLRRKVNRITDILWAGGVTNPVTYIEQISYLIYLKLLDAPARTFVAVGSWPVSFDIEVEAIALAD